MSESRFPGHRVIQHGLVLLATGDNLTFTKNQNMFINYLMNTIISQILLGTRVNASTNGKLYQVISVPTNVS